MACNRHWSVHKFEGWLAVCSCRLGLYECLSWSSLSELAVNRSGLYSAPSVTHPSPGNNGLAEHVLFIIIAEALESKTRCTALPQAPASFTPFYKASYKSRWERTEKLCDEGYGVYSCYYGKSKELCNGAGYNSRCKLVYFTSLLGHKHVIYMLLFLKHVLFCLRNRKMLPYYTRWRESRFTVVPMENNTIINK